MNDIEKAIEVLKMENELMQFDPYVNEDYCCHCNEEIKGIKKLKVWNGKLLPMCYSCWSKWINGGRK